MSGCFARIVRNYKILNQFQSCVLCSTNRTTEPILCWKQILDLKREHFLSQTFERMKVLRVSQSPGTDVVTLSLEINGKNRKLHRPADETLEKTFCRIRATLQSSDKNNKKRKHDETGGSPIEKLEVNVKLLNLDGDKCSLDEKCNEVWQRASLLEIQEEKYRVVYNPPTATMVKLPPSPLAGMTLYPSLQFDFASHQFSKFTWLRSSLNKNNMNGKKGSPTKDNWVVVSNDKLHTPSFDDVGHKFKLQVTPGSETHPANNDDVISDDVIIAEDVSGPVLPARSSYLFDCRHVHTTKKCSGDTFRMVCFNILADCYATQDFARKELFPYCPDDIIKMDYRIQLIQKELEGYHGDLICLQEVDRFVFENHLVSSMSLQNFAGALATKKQCKEGVAVFYNRDRFKLISVENKILQESLTTDEVNKDLLEKVSRNQSLKSSVLQRGSCVLLAVLQSVDAPHRHLVLANTHLFWHPRALNIRLIQMGIILNLVKEKMKTTSASLPEGGVVTPIICGDLNSKPASGLCDLMQDGNIPTNHADWYSGGITNYHGGDWSLSHDMKFVSACGKPTYTNYVTGFSDCLDYIYIDPRMLGIKQVVPHPPHHLVTMHTAIPCVTSPSDHIAQVVDLGWT
uniref:2',5'-phosphodiesterase 12 n=1 Tax=Ciona intestinalis TaxID=7719 RepID=UPI0000521B0E|nr:2',5'-phosphodiesterase 12 [Ciona intestinalis]|eukprot:XP_002119497.1 2',5'-phosphodiesterase 12 [Ciona intestinalis]